VNHRLSVIGVRCVNEEGAFCLVVNLTGFSLQVPYLVWSAAFLLWENFVLPLMFRLLLMYHEHYTLWGLPFCDFSFLFILSLSSIFLLSSSCLENMESRVSLVSDISTEIDMSTLQFKSFVFRKQWFFFWINWKLWTPLNNSLYGYKRREKIDNKK